MILSKSQLVSNITGELSDNSTGQISPYDIRHNLLDIIDSVHNLTSANDLNAKNFSTPSTRTTKAGQKTIENLGLDGYSSTDNSAFGYGALKSNYQGIQNTAIGSSALGCNVYGQDNLAAGVYALAGNTTGIGNVGLGNFSLNNNKLGNFNIAIGHGAGYYAARTTHNKLFIGSHPVDNDYVCSNPLGSGLTPLVYGDLDNNNLKFGIAVRTLHNEAVLQVNGNVASDITDSNNLGTSNYKWRYLYLSSGIYFNNASISVDASGDLNVQGDLLPSSNETYNLGSYSNKWLTGHFENIHVSGNAYLNNFVSITSCQYLCKTLYLAASGECTELNDCAYLSDSEVANAGFVLKSTDRDYSFIFQPQDGSLTCLDVDNVYSRSSWNSNISLHIASGCHVKTDRIISQNNNVAIANAVNCYGMFIENRNTFFANDSVLDVDPTSNSGIIAGIGDVNFISESTSTDDYSISLAAQESGVDVSQRFLSAAKYRSIDTLNSKDKLSGFELKYYDDSDLSYTGPLSDRFVINSHDDTSTPVNSVILMKNSSDGGVFGISSFDGLSDYALPETTFNIRNKSTAIARITAENEGSVYSSLQLLGGKNCLENGLEIQYVNTSGFADINMYKMSGVSTFFRLDEDNRIGIFATVSGAMHDMLTMGDELNTEAVLSIHHSSGVPSGVANYAKLYTQENIDYNQSSSLYFMDSSGNIFDLTLNQYDSYDGLLYTDDNENTFGGRDCPDVREDVVNANGNTAIGYRAFALVDSGDYNTVFGAYAGSGIVNGTNNVAIGYKSLSEASENINHNIVLGTDNVGAGLDTNYNFLVGSHETNILLHGILGPNNSDKLLTLPSGGKVNINNSNDTEFLAINYNSFSLVDNTGSDYPDGQLTFHFTGNETAELLSLQCSGAFTRIPTYADGGRPHAKLSGDLKLLGAVRFSDGTSLESASFLDNITALEDYQSSFIIEGIANADMANATDINTPSYTTITLRGTSTTKTITNRDRLLTATAGDYIIAILIGSEYRPLWVSSDIVNCQCCT